MCGLVFFITVHYYKSINYCFVCPSDCFFQIGSELSILPQFCQFYDSWRQRRSPRGKKSPFMFSPPLNYFISLFSHSYSLFYYLQFKTFPKLPYLLFWCMQIGSVYIEMVLDILPFPSYLSLSLLFADVVPMLTCIFALLAAELPKRSGGSDEWKIKSQIVVF